MRNLNSEVERNVRGLAFAKMYYKVGDYEQALRYVTVYLNSRPSSAEGQNLQGKILERIGKTSQALEAYRLSLDLDCKQNSLVLKICELMAKEQHHFDAASARYYCEKARSIDPQNPVIFHLKERLVAAASKDPNDVTELLLKELESRPLDVDVRVRLLRHLKQHNRAREAYTHAYDIEQKQVDAYLNHLKWCETVVDVLGVYRNTQNVLTWEFWMLYVCVWDRYVALSLNDRTRDLEHAPLVLGLDQAIQLAADKLGACPQKQLVQEFIKHYTGQLCWHLLTLLYKQARKALIKYREAGQMGLPLLFASYNFKPADKRALWLDQATQGARLQVQRWHREGAYRCAQAGHMLTSLAQDRKTTILERGTQAVTGAWREKTFKFLFITRDQQKKASTSFFILTQNLLDIQVRLPEPDDLVAYTKTAQLVHPDSLHHHIWLGMNSKLQNFEVTVFPGLQYTVKTFTNCAAETLNVLDIQAFIYAATLCGQAQQEEQKHTIYYNADRPQVLPIACTDLLGTVNQETWLHCAYKMFTNHPTRDLSEVRMTLIRGIETVRCVGNHGLDAKLLVQLARTFADRATKVTKQSEIEANEARAELYWRAALYLLEKHKKNEHVSHTNKRLFEYKVKELNQDQIHQAINDGKLFMGKQAMKKKDYETAMSAFKNVKDPYASFYQAQIYKKMADLETNLKSENVTSEMRSQNIILLTKARDCFYLTSDRLRMPGVDPKHPLFEVLFTDIEKIDRLLSRIDPDNNRNECDGMSDDNVSSIESDFNCTMSRLETSHHGVHSTPFRMDHSRRDNRDREARPSPERLDAQIRQLAASKDVALNKVLEQNKFVIETQKVLAEELKFFRESVSDLTSTINELKSLKIVVEDVKEIKKTVDELENLRTVSDMVYELRKEVAELKKDNAAAGTSKSKQNQLSDEDLYVFDDDYATEMANAHASLSTSLYQNASRMNQMNQSASMQNLGYPASPMYGYPMYPPYGGMPGMAMPQVPGVPGVPGVGYPQAHQDAAAHLAADYRAMNLLQGYSQLASGMQAPALAQQLTASPGYMAQQYPQVSLFGGTAAQNTSTVTSQPLSFGTAATQGQLTNVAGSVTITTTSSGLSTTTSASASARPAPVNVVITSSDPLPKTVTTQQQVLSVTIPPEHLKGNKVHNYQITLPSSVSSLANAPSVLSQAPMVVSTQALLSNVSAPVYSALSESPTKTTSSSTALGLQIEKSLNNSFNRTANESEGDVSRDDEHDPCPDFKPIIPLPDEVPVTTGEENEKVLFKERAKLFRYVAKEWKERGVGELKILQHNDTKKVRLLMRRDQVHKICANHYLEPDMELSPMNNNPKAYIWPANDFSDGNVVLETFCVQFKTPELAKKFYDCFEKSKIMKESPAATSVTTMGNSSTPKATTSNTSMFSSTPSTTTTSNVGGFKFTSTPTFKPKEDETPKAMTAKPAEPPKSAASPFAGFSFTPTANTGTTPVSKPFSAFSFSASTTASTDKPTATNLFASLSSPSTFTVNKTSVATPTTSVSTPVKPIEASALTPLGKPSTPSEVQSPSKNETADDFVPTAEFTPVIPLPDIVEIKTGEEDAEILFENKAKLLRFDSTTKEWKERGVGQMKVLKGNNILRLVMRREQVHKVCCNHQVLKQMQFSRMVKSQCAITWCAKDFSEGVLTTEMLAIRFKTTEIATTFLQVIQDAQSEMDEANYIGGAGVDKADSPHKKHDSKSLITTLKEGFGDAFKPKVGDWECKNCLIVNLAKVSRCVACETPKNDAVAKATVDDSKFCFGVKPPVNASSASFSFGTNSATSTTGTGVSGSFGDQFKPKQGSWECKECYTRNDEAAEKCVSCEVPKSGATAAVAPSSTTCTLKGVDLSTGGLSFSFGFPPPASNTPQSGQISQSDADSSASAVSSTTSIPSVGFGNQFKPKADSWECKECYTRNDGGILYCLSCEGPKDSTVPPKSASSNTSTLKGVDLSTGGQQFSFGIPVQTTSANDINKPFSFAAAGETAKAGFSFSLSGTPKAENKEGDVEEVFGSPHKIGFEFTPRSPRRQSGGQQLDEDGGDDSYYEEEEANVYFKPVIPLPDKVTVTTGEEDEDVLYCHRAKLYRHAGGEWKERGIGDLKILFQKEQHKLRVLMRREQVHKICLNHVLTRDIVYNKKDDKTWLFAAADFSEGEIDHCSFCLRFKTAEVAEEFMKAINDALKRTGSDGNAETAGIEGSDSDVEFVSETQVSPEEQAEAKRLLLPPKFMAYRQLDDCKCEQCLKDDAVEKGAITPQKNLFGGGVSASQKTLFGIPKSTFSFGSFASPATQPASAPAKQDSVKDLLLKPSILGTTAATGFNFGSPVVTTTPPVANPAAAETKPSLFGNFAGKPTPTGSIFAQATLPGTPFSGENIFGLAANSSVSTANIFGGGTTKTGAESTFSFASIAKQAEADSKEVPKIGGAPTFSFASMGKPKEGQTATPTFGSEVAEPVLGAGSNLSFASFAATAENMPFGKPKVETDNPFAKLGAGAPVFGAKLSNTSKTDDNDEEGGAGDGDHDPHYDPIVPLPDEVEVKTGEEDEEVLFSERGKLYRFANKEWKERGVGNIKVLYHAQNNSYRLLLRREAVHKIVLNQRITPELEVIAFTLSANAWMWCGMNYGEEGHVLEQLAARFKNEALSQAFYAAIQKAIAAVRASSTPSKPNVNENVSDVDEDDEDEDEDDEDNEDKEDDYDEEDDDRTVMYSCECALYQQVGANWKPLIQHGLAEVVYDREKEISSIIVIDDVGIILSNTLIAANSNMERKPDDSGCELHWKAVEHANDVCEWRTLKLKFDSEDETESFFISYQEAKSYAEQSNIIDEIPTDVYYSGYEYES